MDFWIAIGIFLAVMIVSAVLNILTQNGLKLVGMLLLVLFIVGMSIIFIVSLIQSLLGYPTIYDLISAPFPYSYYIFVAIFGFASGILMTMGTPPTV